MGVILGASAEQERVTESPNVKKVYYGMGHDKNGENRDRTCPKMEEFGTTHTHLDHFLISPPPTELNLTIVDIKNHF